jgi:hypothetical protein
VTLLLQNFVVAYFIVATAKKFIKDAGCQGQSVVLTLLAMLARLTL